MMGGADLRRRARPIVLIALMLALVLPQSRPPMALAQPGGTTASVPFPIPADADLTPSAVLVVNDTPPDLPDEMDLGPVAVAAFAQADTMPEGEWTVEGLAAALDYDPMAAFTFVRDRIAFDPYPGVLRGASGTLSARAGNAWDRAALLAALLDAMVVPYQFAFADLDTSTAERLVERSREPATLPLPTPGMEVVPAFKATEVHDRAARDYALLRAALGGALTDPGPGAESATSVLDAVRPHVWVQAAFGAGWLDMDPTLRTATAGTTLSAPTSTAKSLPDEARQTVTLRLVVQEIDAAGIAEQQVLEQVLDPVLLERSEIFLYFEPRYDGIGGSILSALSGEQPWTPVLMVDGVATVGTPFSVGGRGTDVFGTQTDTTELASMRLTVERSAPGRAPEQGVRVLLDRASTGLPGPAPMILDPLITDAAGPVVLGQVHHLMISTGSASARDYAALRGLVADFVAGELLGQEEPSFSFADLLWPVAATDQALVVASERGVVPSLADAPGWRAFVDAPRVYLASFGPDDADGGLRFETDLLLDGVALLAPPGEAAGASRLRQLWYGALQTALESEFVRIRSGALVPDGRQLGGASFSMGPAAVPADGLGSPTSFDGASPRGGTRAGFDRHRTGTGRGRSRVVDGGSRNGCHTFGARSRSRGRLRQCGRGYQGREASPRWHETRRRSRGQGPVVAGSQQPAAQRLSAGPGVRRARGLCLRTRRPGDPIWGRHGRQHRGRHCRGGARESLTGRAALGVRYQSGDRGWIWIWSSPAARSSTLPAASTRGVMSRSRADGSSRSSRTSGWARPPTSWTRPTCSSCPDSSTCTCMSTGAVPTCPSCPGRMTCSGASRPSQTPDHRAPTTSRGSDASSSSPSKARSWPF